MQQKGAETSAAGEQRKQSNTSTVSVVAVRQQPMKPGIIRSGSGALVERFSQAVMLELIPFFGF